MTIAEPGMIYMHKFAMVVYPSPAPQDDVGRRPTIIPKNSPFMVLAIIDDDISAIDDKCILILHSTGLGWFLTSFNQKFNRII